MKYAQQHYYGSRNFRASFSRRTYIEGFFGNIKNHRTGNIHRGFHQFEGQVLVTLAVTAAVVAYNLRELETWFLRASILNDPSHWATLRTGEKTRGPQTRARLADYAAHPLLQQTRHQFGFVMLTAAQQEAVDADHIARSAPNPAGLHPFATEATDGGATPATGARPFPPPGLPTAGPCSTGTAKPAAG